MRIALVDPSRTTRLIVSRMLSARGHEVLPFADERDALVQIKADPCIDALITSAELKHISGVELCWETRLMATCRRPIYVLMMSSQYDQRSLIEALDLRRRRFHRQAASGRGALCAAPRRRADSLYAARFDPARHHRSPDRFEQPARFLRARDGGLRARGSRRMEACRRSSSISTISNTSTTPTGMKPATRRSAAARVPHS